MTVNSRSRKKAKVLSMEQRRLRLRDWLEIKIDDPKYPGLEWVNKEKTLFRIPWKHGARHGWREEKDARLFREWSEHTGASPRDVKQHKANFRCALNSLTDVCQVHNMNKSKGDDAYRVYQMKPKRTSKRTSMWIKRRENPQIQRDAKSKPQQEVDPVCSQDVDSTGYESLLPECQELNNHPYSARGVTSSFSRDTEDFSLISRSACNFPVNQSNQDFCKEKLLRPEYFLPNHYSESSNALRYCTDHSSYPASDAPSPYFQTSPQSSFQFSPNPTQHVPPSGFTHHRYSPIPKYNSSPTTSYGLSPHQFTPNSSPHISPSPASYGYVSAQSHNDLSNNSNRSRQSGYDSPPLTETLSQIRKTEASNDFQYYPTSPCTQSSFQESQIRSSETFHSANGNDFFISHHSDFSSVNRDTASHPALSKMITDDVRSHYDETSDRLVSLSAYSADCCQVKLEENGYYKEAPSSDEYITNRDFSMTSYENEATRNHMNYGLGREKMSCWNSEQHHVQDPEERCTASMDLFASYEAEFCTHNNLEENLCSGLDDNISVLSEKEKTKVFQDESDVRFNEFSCIKDFSSVSENYLSLSINVKTTESCYRLTVSDKEDLESLHSSSKKLPSAYTLLPSLTETNKDIGRILLTQV